jgi:hypothetical protein
LTVTEAGVLCLLLFALFHWLGRLPKTRSVLAFLGAVAVGTAGFVGHIFTSIGAFLTHATGSVTAYLFGASLSVALFVLLAIVLVHDWHPKHGASGRTGWVALAVGVLLAGSVAAIPALAPVVGLVHSVLGGATSFINTL